VATTLKTWSFLAGAESWTWTTGANSTATWTVALGNPLGSHYDDITGKSKSNTNYCEISGTWEALFAVTAGVTVTKAQLTGGYVNCTACVSPGTCTRGLVEIRDSAGTTVVATLRAATSLTTTDAGWVAISGSLQTIGAAYQASGTTIRVRYTDVLATLTAGAPNVRNYFDELGITVTTKQDYTLSCATTSFAVTGTAATFLRLVCRVSAAGTSFAVSGTAAGVRKSWVPISAVAGSAAITGTAASPWAILRINQNQHGSGWEIGAYVYFDPTAIAVTGAYVLTGGAAGFKTGYGVGPASGTFTITGTAATPGAARILGMDSGAFAVTGTAATPNSARYIATPGTSYQFTGTATDLRSTRYISGSPTEYNVTGTAAIGVASHIPLDAEAFSLVVGGTSADLTCYFIYVPPTYTLIAERAQQ
jgi:hypothetical protein